MQKFWLRKFVATLLIIGSLGLGSANADNATLGDYNNDGLTDTVVTRPEGGLIAWYIRNTADGYVSRVPFGLSSDEIHSGDFDGDGDFTPGVVRTVGLFKYWYLMANDGSAQEIPWGLAGDVSRVGSYDADSIGDLVSVRNVGSDLLWLVRRSKGEQLVTTWGLPGDASFAGDLDGDGVDELIVARKLNGAWLWLARTVSGKALNNISWGLEGDDLLPPYDVNGDGRDDLIVLRNEGGYLKAYVRLNGAKARSAGEFVIPFGLKGDVPFFGGFLGDSTGQFGVYRAVKNGVSNVYLTGIASWPFGLEKDYFVTPWGIVLEIGKADRSVKLADPLTPVEDDTGDDGLASVCSRISGVSKGTLWKPSSDDSGPPRQGKPAMLFKAVKPSDGCAELYASDGTRVGGLGVYTWAGKYGARFYSGWGCGGAKSGSQMESAAIAASGKRSVYVHIGGGRCIGPIVPTQRTGAL